MRGGSGRNDGVILFYTQTQLHAKSGERRNAERKGVTEDTQNRGAGKGGTREQRRM